MLRRIVLEEIHRLPNPSELLKIVADHYPEVKIVATGSATLGASSRFKDTLPGRMVKCFIKSVPDRNIDKQAGGNYNNFSELNHPDWAALQRTLSINFTIKE